MRRRENGMVPAVQLALIFCAVRVLLLVTARRQITKLRKQVDGWRDNPIQFGAELGGRY
ncbi:hypothetical protein MOKP101_45700 [Mycobacterium avium subsp. hominissuis]